MDLANISQRCEVNCVPRSLVMTSGRPNLDIHPDRRALIQLLVEDDCMGTASDHLVDRSIIVRRFLNPWDDGNGLTMFT